MEIRKNLYTTAIGAWGDAIAAYGNTCKILSEIHRDSCNMLYYGFDSNIAEFLQYQKHVDEVMHVVPESEQKYIQVATDIAVKRPIDLGFLFSKLPPDSQVMASHIGQEFLDSKDCNRNFDCYLEPQNVYFTLPCKKKLLVQPFSITSVPKDRHWPYWFNAIEWLAERGDWHIVLVGQERGGLGSDFVFPEVNLPNMTNLVGSTKSMLDVFQLANQCDAILTTSNSLSMWSILINKPTFVMCNMTITGHDYFQNWIDHPPNSVHKGTTPYHKFIEEFEKWEM